MIDEVVKTAQVILDGGVVLYPTDTVWGVGCDARNEGAVNRIYKIKRRSETKSMILLVDTIDRLKMHVDEVPEIALKLIREAQKPLTIIYPKAKNLPLSLISSDGSIAIRVVDNEFCQRLIEAIDSPLVSTSANISGEPTPNGFENISTKITEQMDYVVSPSVKANQSQSPSSIIRIIGQDAYEVIR